MKLRSFSLLKTFAKIVENQENLYLSQGNTSTLFSFLFSLFPLPSSIVHPTSSIFHLQSTAIHSCRSCSGIFSMA